MPRGQVVTNLQLVFTSLNMFQQYKFPVTQTSYKKQESLRSMEERRFLLPVSVSSNAELTAEEKRPRKMSIVSIPPLQRTDIHVRSQYGRTKEEDLKWNPGFVTNLTISSTEATLVFSR